LAFIRPSFGLGFYTTLSLATLGAAWYKIPALLRPYYGQKINLPLTKTELPVLGGKEWTKNHSKSFLRPFLLHIGENWLWKLSKQMFAFLSVWSLFSVYNFWLFGYLVAKDHNFGILRIFLFWFVPVCIGLNIQLKTIILSEHLQFFS